MTNIQKIIDQAELVLGEHHAIEWLDKRSETLGNTPRRLAESHEGTLAVLLHLASISRHNQA